MSFQLQSHSKSTLPKLQAIHTTATVLVTLQWGFTEASVRVFKWLTKNPLDLPD